MAVSKKRDPSEEIRKKGLSKDKPTLKIQDLYFYDLGDTTLQCLKDNGFISSNLGAYGKKSRTNWLFVLMTDQLLLT